MAATTINLPLYQVLTDLKVPEDRAQMAAEASIPDLSNLATRDDLKGVEDRLSRDIAERAHNQTKWIVGTVVALLGVSAILWPPTRFAATPPQPAAVTLPQR